MIHIFDNYYILIDGKNYIAVTDDGKQDKKGKPIRNIIGYFGTLRSALFGLRDHIVTTELSEGVYELPEAISKIDEVGERFKKELDKHGITNDEIALGA